MAGRRHNGGIVGVRNTTSQSSAKGRFSLNEVQRALKSGVWPGWSPSVLFAAGEQGVWYDPSDFSTMFQDSAGTTPVTAVGQPVGRILDKSGRGNHASQSTSAARPVLGQEAGGQYYLSFDGTDDYLQVASFVLPLIQRMTCIGFAETAAVANQGCISVYPATGNDYDSTTGYVSCPSNRTTSRYIETGSNPPYYSLLWTQSPTDIIPRSVITGNKQTNVGSLRVNGTQVDSASGFTQFSANSNGGLLLGARWVSGAVLSTLKLSGRFYQVIIRGAETTDAQILNTEGYVNSKTGAY